MKSFREFIIEKSEADPISRKDAEKLQRMARPETSSSSAKRISRGLESAQARIGRKTRRAPSALTQGEIAGAWKSGSAGKPSVVATSSKPESGTWFGSSKEAIKQGQEGLRQQVRDTLAKNRGGSAELQAAQSSGPKETMVGTGAKSGTGETYRANRPSETKATGVSNLPPKGQSRGRTGSKQFSGDARYREMLAKIPNAEPKKPKTTTVKQSEVSKDIAQKTTDYKTERGEAAYKKTAADIDARKSFPTGKGGLKADERNPYVKREVRQARAAKMGGNVWDQPKGTNRPFKDLLKIRPSRDTKIDIITKMKAAQQKKQGYPDIDWKATTKPKQSKPAGAPDRSSVRQAIRDLRASKSKSSTPSTLSTPPKPQSSSKSYSEIPSKFQVPKKDIPTQRPVNATTHGVDSQGNYLSKAERKRIHSGKAGEVVKYQPPKAEVAPTPSKPKELTAKDVGKQVSKSISKTQARGRVGAGAVLSALGSAQEYNVGAARAKAEGKGKLGQLFRGAMRAGGAFLGGTGGAALGGAVTKSGIGAAAAGAYGYAKGAEAGSRLAKKVEKSSAGKWLAKTAKKYVPGLA